MNAPTCGSLFSGAGLLDLGLHLAGFRHAWLCESDSWRRELLRARFPGVPVYDDIRGLRGQVAADTDGQRLSLGCGVEMGAASRVALIAGGFPCKGASSAGKQNGFEHAETVLWHEMRRVIGELRPRVVLIENVANILGMAASPSEPSGSLWGTVLADLAAFGLCDIRWDCVPAGAVGAPHLRDRVFCVATHAAGIAERVQDNEAHPIAGGGHPKPAAATDTERLAIELRGGARAVGEASTGGGGATRQQRVRSTAAHRNQNGSVAVDWGAYAPAIRRWEAIHGAAPEPLVRGVDDGDPGVRRMRARVDRSRLSALGDGVHVHVAWLVGQHVMSLLRPDR